MPGKLWKREEEQLLRSLWESGVNDIKLLAEKINRSEGAIREKLKRMGLRVVIHKKPAPQTTTRELMPSDLLTHEETLRILTGAITEARKPGLDKLDIMQLKILVDAAKTYDSVLEKFERWVEIEARLSEMDKRIAELQKTKGNGLLSHSSPNTFLAISRRISSFPCSIFSLL